MAAAVSVWWLGAACGKVADDKVWARKLFVFSIVAITALSVMMSVDFMVPDSHSLLAYEIITHCDLKPRIYGAFSSCFIIAFFSFHTSLPPRRFPAIFHIKNEEN
ncbi:hypothetical protein [Klebsiella pneumoniae]|uniref:hypothetical protein n=1 Tax=Klebsiella pneumoniae TaxID=573 RepID=UPI000F24565D|nr:Protoheme IX farnesyltransferase [Klebsiella pneumoniae]